MIYATKLFAILNLERDISLHNFFWPSSDQLIEAFVGCYCTIFKKWKKKDMLAITVLCVLFSLSCAVMSFWSVSIPLHLGLPRGLDACSIFRLGDGIKVHFIQNASSSSQSSIFLMLLYSSLWSICICV